MSKKIKISVVGIGLMGLQHIKAIQKSKFASLHSIVEIKKTGGELSNKFKVIPASIIKFCFVHPDDTSEER